ncbi:hypothetical protein JCM5296_004100, partial [Sporobolomyces johnsonii]
MRCATVFAGLLILPAALALALPGDYDSSYGLSPFEQGDYSPVSSASANSQSLDSSGSDAEDAANLDKDDEADKNIDYANVQFSDVNYDSTTLKDNE